MNRNSLRAGSLRGRVTRTTLVVVAGVLLAVLLLLDAFYGILARQQFENRLADRARFAVQMEERNVPPERLVQRISGAGIDAQIVTAAGTVHSAGTFTSPADAITLTRNLPSNSMLTLTADTSMIDRSRATLRIVMILAGLVALAVTALILPFTVRRTVHPMDTMADLARAIARGERGRRLAPERTDTELGRTAAAFDAMLDSLEQAERHAHESEARTRRFLADVAHELRTPLAGVQATAEAVLHASDTQQREERDRMHLLLAREARRAGRLVDDLLLLARVDAGLELHQEPVALLALCTAEAGRLQLQAPGLRITVAGDDVTVPGDAHRLGQVIANLLNNAHRHGATDVGATIEVNVHGHPDDVTVDVADTGRGIAPSQHELIFHRFIRHHTAGASGGAGLGLPIARAIARAHGGDLRCVQLPPGARGALFRLTLPRNPLS